MANNKTKIIKWINRFSGETGYVKVIRKAKGYFENTFDSKEARLFSDAEASKALVTLSDIGEAQNNQFEIVPAV